MSCLGVFEGVSGGRVNVGLRHDWAKHPFSHNLGGHDFFHLTLLRHQNIKTSQCNVSKNGWVLPFYVIFGPVRKKLQFTVLLDHPVVVKCH